VKKVLMALVLMCSSVLAGPEKHLLYFTSPDGAQGGGSGVGLIIYDINDGHKLVRRIEVPSFKGGVRGVCANALTKRLYVSTSKETLICMDLLTDKSHLGKKLWHGVRSDGGDAGRQDVVCAIGLVGREGSSLDGGGWDERRGDQANSGGKGRRTIR
jgi:hypothetical protein